MGFNSCRVIVVAICIGFERYHLNTHAFCKQEHTPTHQNHLKPMRIAAKDTPTPHKSYKSASNPCVWQQLHSTHTRAAGGAAAAVVGELFVWSPSVREHLPRTRTASHRTHERIEIELEITFPFAAGRINRTIVIAPP